MYYQSLLKAFCPQSCHPNANLSFNLKTLEELKAHFFYFITPHSLPYNLAASPNIPGNCSCRINNNLLTINLMVSSSSPYPIWLNNDPNKHLFELLLHYRHHASIGSTKKTQYCYQDDYRLILEGRRNSAKELHYIALHGVDTTLILLNERMNEWVSEWVDPCIHLNMDEFDLINVKIEYKRGYESTRSKTSPAQYLTLIILSSPWNSRFPWPPILNLFSFFISLRSQNGSTRQFEIISILVFFLSFEHLIRVLNPSQIHPLHSIPIASSLCRLYLPLFYYNWWTAVRIFSAWMQFFTCS